MNGLPLSVGQIWGGDIRPRLVLHTIGGDVVLDPIKGDPVPWPLSQILTGYEIVLGEPVIPQTDLLSLRAQNLGGWVLMIGGALVMLKAPLIGAGVAAAGFWVLNR